MKQKHLEDIINKMFEIAGIDMDYKRVLPRKDEWYLEYQMTQEQNDEWVRWTSDYLYNNRVYTKGRAKKQADHINFSYGLKIKDNA
jgi:hypothetical protein